MKKLFLIFFIILNSFANEFEFSEDFNSFLKDESEIATKSKLNVDYAPNIITILKGETLEKLGAKDLFEALSFVPGIDTNRKRHGTEDLNIRGVFNGYYGSKYKILINEIPITQLFTYEFFPYLPIEQIGRIEIIRGPGSSIYGENAFSGVINIVTKKGENSLFFKEEFFSENQRGKVGGGSLSFGEDELKINILASQNKSDGDKIISNNKLIENLNNHHYSLIDLNYKNTNFTLINFSNMYGNFYGYGVEATPYDGKENAKANISTASLKQKVYFRDNLYLNIMASYSNVQNIAKDIIVYTNPYQDLKMDLSYKEKQCYLNFDFHYELQNHTLLAGYYLQDTKQKKSYKKFNFNPLTFQPIINQPAILVEDKGSIKRANRAIYLQDIYRVNDNFSLTLGVRNDEYSDIKDSFTPKIAGVYEIDEGSILKAQFAKAFRTPSFNEIYNFAFPLPFTNKNINSEIINTYELAYILNRDDYSLKTNLFYSKLSDLIFFDLNTYIYSNIANANTKGFEIEFIKNYGENLIINSNLSYSEAKYENIDISKIDNFMFNLALFIKPYSTESFSIWYKYINENVKEVINRHNSRNHHVIDLNFEKTFIVNSNTLITKIGVKNLFDSEYRYFDNENLNLVADGRSLWISLNYEF